MPMVPAWLWPLLAAPFVGSFLGVLVLRLPAEKPVVLSRSACPHCNATLQGRDLVPLASFVLLRGRCRYCRQPIGWLHPMIELAALAVAGWAVLVEPDVARLWVDCGLGWTLLTLGWIDATCFLLPDVLTLPLLLAGLTLTAARDPDRLTDHALGAAVGYLSMQGLAWAYRNLRGREGLGGGDAKLIAASGAWCGLAALPFIVFVSAVLGLIAALGLALSGRSITSRTWIPFGSCIAAALWLVWLHGGLLMDLQRILGGT